MGLASEMAHKAQNEGCKHKVCVPVSVKETIKENNSKNDLSSFCHCFMTDNYVSFRHNIIPTASKDNNKSLKSGTSQAG